MIIKQLVVGSMSVCCYVIGCSETKIGAVIDPGGSEDKIMAAVRQEGLQIKYIINTHGHPDHVCGNGPLKEATGAAIVMHKADADFFGQADTKQYFSMLGLPESPPVDKMVQGGDILSVGRLKLKVIHTPGHTPGGICLYDSPHLFSGDTLFVGGVGRSDFPGGSADLLQRSIQECLLSLPEDTVVWPGHGYGGDSSTIGAEKRSNPFCCGNL
ncbi:MAG: MBL fold metallo-hydrolase [Deltaproteobacteria bacterium]|nr:MBL fold metallo-hydrolase [Deltaproteobacteria bacterium]